jgi:hypothetical protein
MWVPSGLTTRLYGVVPTGSVATTGELLLCAFKSNPAPNLETVTVDRFIEVSLGILVAVAVAAVWREEDSTTTS